MRLNAPNGPSVLIIERDDAIRWLLGALLGRAGMTVHTAESAEGGAAILDEGDIDVIVADSESGSLDPDYLPRTVVVTTRATARIRGAFAVVRKPFDVFELLSIVRSCLRRWRGSDRGRPSADDALRRFVSDLPNLRRELTAPMSSPRELLLRGEMRQTILELSKAFHQAAAAEPNRARAEAFLAASAVAAELAAGDRRRIGRDN